MRRSLDRLHAVLAAGFVLVALALGYWQFFRADELLNAPTNPRLAERESQTVRGRILDRRGDVLAETRLENGRARRGYPEPTAAHVIGYHTSRFGDSGIESAFDSYLRGDRSSDPLRRLFGALFHRPMVGDDIALTLDSRIQRAAREALGDDRGAVVALDPRTGEVLALASNPGFDPASVEDDWEKLATDEARPLINRATQSRFPPGSTFKLITAAAVLDLGLVDPNARFRCTREMDLGGLKVDCRNHAHLASVNFREAFAWSCNRSFALAGLQLGYGPLDLGDGLARPAQWERDGIEPSAARLEDYAARFQFGRNLPFDLELAVSTLKGEHGWYASLLGQTAFGQGEIQATPMLMALSAATIANGGVVPAPYLAAEVRSPGGARTSLHQGRPSLGVAVRPETAALLNEMMVLSVDVAYAQKARIPGVKVAGKTGTAEAGPAGTAPHSWFIGYAPADDPRVAIAVILEHKGSGSDFATPAAQRVLRVALDVYGPREGRQARDQVAR